MLNSNSQDLISETLMKQAATEFFGQIELVKNTVLQDYFTKWPEEIPLKDVTAKSVADVLLSVISMWGPPAELLSNQGPEFVMELNHELLATGDQKAICKGLPPPN